MDLIIFMLISLTHKKGYLTTPIVSILAILLLKNPPALTRRVISALGVEQI